MTKAVLVEGALYMGRGKRGGGRGGQGFVHIRELCLASVKPETLFQLLHELRDWPGSPLLVVGSSAASCCFLIPCSLYNV